MPLARALETRDFDLMARVFVHWDYRLEQLGSGPFHGRIRFADLGGAQIFDARLNLAVRTRGERWPDSFTFSPIITANADSVWRGRVLRPGMVNVAGPQHEMDHRTNPGYRHTALTVRRDLLESLASTLLGVDALTLLGSDQAPRLDGRLLANLRRRWLGSIRSLAAGIARAEPEELVADLVRTLAAGRVVDPFRTTPADRRRVVREAEEFALASPPGAATIVALCRRTGVSERTLHYAFVEVTGLGPAAYLKTARLNRARLDLMAGERARGRVEEVARRHGFDRPGDFAASYRRLFGTLPSLDLGARRVVG